MKELDFAHATDATIDEEDEAILSAIDEGIRAADEDRVVPEEEVRKMIPRWITKFSIPNPR